jgi:3'-5' exoribonuclease
MAEKLFIEDFEKGMQVSETFYVEEKSLKTSTRGEPYLDLMLKDRTGSISGKVWKNAGEISSAFERGDFVTASGLVEDYRDRLQLRVVEAKRLERDKVRHEDFVRSLEPEKVEAYLAHILKIIDQVKDPFLKALLDSFFRDPEFQKTFARCPAARSIHHDMAGGLLRHTCTMLTVASFLAGKIYRNVNYDVLVTGILLHDLGKVEELEMDVSIDYTDEGLLLGHSVIGIRLMRERIGKIPGFPQRLAALLEHIFISHHGEFEYGAIKKPMTREAMLVHFIDTMDAKMDIMDKAIKGLAPGEYWTEKCWPLGDLKILDTESFLAGEGQAGGPEK